VKPPYHVCLVVEDVEHAMDEISSALGFTWGRIQDREIRMESPGEPVQIDMRYVYSLDGPPYFELIERRDGSVFDTVGLHHIGVWTDDPAAESTRLDGLGCSRETVALTPDGDWAGGLFHTVGCLRVEVVDIGRSGPRLANYLSGGDYTAPG
jgi:hypothetical protein